jgi:C1A family cysteine protease
MYRIHYDWYAYNTDKKRGEKFVLDDPDNRKQYEYINISYKEMYAKVVESVKSGHAVYWEYGENHSSGHAMAIVGLKNTKKSGGESLICLNSYGTEWGNNGKCVINPQFFLSHTCNIGVCR